MNKIITTLMFFIILISNSFGRELIIAGIPEEPNRWIDKNGKLTGVDIDIIDYIMKKNGIEYKIVLEGSSARLEAGWQNATPAYDMVFTYSKNKEREQFLYYPQESHVDFSWNFFVRKEDEKKYKFDKFEDLKGVKIGATTGFSYSDEFWDAVKKGVITVEEIPKNELQMAKLLNNRIDMVPLNTQATLYEAKKDGTLSKIAYLPKAIKSKPYYNTFVKKSTYPQLTEVMKKYDATLAEMKKDGTLKKILAKYGI